MSRRRDPVRDRWLSMRLCARLAAMAGFAGDAGWPGSPHLETCLCRGCVRAVQDRLAVNVAGGW